MGVMVALRRAGLAWPGRNRAHGGWSVIVDLDILTLQGGADGGTAAEPAGLRNPADVGRSAAETAFAETTVIAGGTGRFVGASGSIPETGWFDPDTGYVEITEIGSIIYDASSGPPGHRNLSMGDSRAQINRVRVPATTPRPQGNRKWPVMAGCNRWWNSNKH